MKKIFKITGIILVVIILLLVALPYFFKDKIEVLIKEEGNKLLNAEFDFSSLDISLIRKFPLASVTLENFYLKGVGEFENDTLVDIEKFSVSVNMLSLFGDEGFDISEVLLYGASLKAVVLPDGTVNWDVMKESDTVDVQPEDTVVTEEESSPFRIKLKKFALNDFSLVYDDRKEKLFAQIENMDATCSGDFGSTRTIINLNTDAESVTFRMGGVPYINNVEVEADIDIDADLENSKFTLNDNSIRLNAIVASLNGWLAMNKEGIDMDIELNSNKIGFKEILSLIPAIYTKDFDGLKTDGNAILSAKVKGTLIGDSIVPQFNVAFDVKDAMFRYSSLPAGVDNINISANISNPGGSIDRTVVTVNPFNFVMAGNPFAITTEIKTPISDLHFDVTAKGKLDLGKIKDIYPLEDMQLNGVLNANLGVEGNISSIEKEKYDKINANGTLSLNDMLLQMNDIPDVNIMNSVFTFTPRYLNLSETTVQIGDNDVTFDSRFENYMGYLFKGTTLKGELNVKSNRFNLNDFMTAESTTVEDETSLNDNVETVTDTTAIGVIRVPDNIDFRMQTSFKEVFFDNMEFNDMQGLLLIKDGKIDMKNLSLNTMGGNVVVNGYYSTQKESLPHFNAGFKLNEIGFAKAYDDLNVVRTLAPIFSNLTGNFSGSVSIDTDLDNNMRPVISAMNGKGALSTRDLSLNEVTIIQIVADAVKKPSLKDTKVKDLNLEFTIENGRVTTKPFDVKLGDYKMNLSGSTGLDRTIDYKGEITIPTTVGKLSKLGTVDMLITGTFKSPKVSIDMESLAKKAASSAAESLLDKVLGGKSDNEEEDSSSESKKDGGAGKLLNKALDFLKK